MNSAALLLMLVVRIYADNVEGPTGKKNNDKMGSLVLGVSSKHAGFCVVVDDAAAVVCALFLMIVIQMLLLKLKVGLQPL